MINITIRTNRDRAVVERVRKALRENNGYCPCSLVKDEDHLTVANMLRGTTFTPLWMPN